MSRKGNGGLLAALALGLVLSSSPFACSSSATLAGPGGACSLVTDCQDGLVCCNGSKGSLTCVASVSCLQPAGAGGTDAGGPPATGQDDATAGADSNSPPATDAAQQADSAIPKGPPDTGTPPVVDAGRPMDTGTVEEAAPPPPPDSGGGGDAPAE